MELRGKELSCYLNNIQSAGLWKCLDNHYLANKAYFSAIIVKNIYENFTHKMAAKDSWHWNYVTVTLCISMLAGFLRHLVGKTLRNVLLAWYGLNTLCHQVIDHKDFFLTQLIQFYRNNAINLRPLTPHIATSYPQNGYRFVTIDLWRNFTVICIGISHYVCVSHGT